MRYAKLERLDGDDVVFIRGEVIEADEADGEVFLSDIADDESGRHDYVITVFDAAGNASEPTIVAADLGCPGSCAASTGAPTTGLAFALFALTRKRKR